MYDYFEKNHLFDSALHGYRRNRSTVTALLAMYDKWVSAANRGDISGAVLIDLSAAFDLVSHDMLLEKLRIYGFQEDFLNWIASYLSNRFQSVWIDHVFSSYLPNTVGVPQGSILGPLFFIIFFNDLPKYIQESIECYADDSTISASAKNMEDLSLKLTRDCCEINSWMHSNKSN